MRAALIVLALVASACAAEQIGQTESKICSVEDQEAGTCPDGSWYPGLAWPSTQAHRESNYPGSAELDGHCYGAPSSSPANAARTCALHFDWNQVSYLLVCTFEYHANDDYVPSCGCIVTTYTLISYSCTLT